MVGVNENSFGFPSVEIVCCTAILVVPVRITDFSFAQDQTDDIVWVCPIELILLFL